MEHRLQDQHTFLQQTKEILSALLRRAQEEMPESGDFPPIIEQFTNSDPQFYCSDVCMVIKNPPSSIDPDETKRYLGLIVKTPSGISNCSCYLASGNKAELLRYLANELFVDELQQKIPEMANELRTDQFA